MLHVDQVIQIVRLITLVQWSYAAAWLAAGVFFWIGIRLLKAEPPTSRGKPDPWVEWYRIWQKPLVGLAFMTFGCWAVGGADIMFNNIWHLIALLIVSWIGLKVLQAIRAWFAFIPMLGRHYMWPGLGKIMVHEIKEISPDAQIWFVTLGENSEFGEGSELYQTNLLTFFFQATPIDE